MDPFARKMLLGAVAFGSAMALMAGALTVVYVHTHPRCSEQILVQTESPNAQWIAAVTERRCGEDSPFFIHVNLRPATEPLRLGFFSGKAVEGEVFLMEQEAARIMPTLQWTAPNELTIQCSRCRTTFVRKHEERWGPVTLRYQLAP
jgi:hypothetical protein